MSFRANAIAKAQNKPKSFNVPSRLLTAYMLDKTGWSYAELRQTPQHVIDELLLLWEMTNEARKRLEPKG